jgi:hypothetical protein
MLGQKFFRACLLDTFRCRLNAVPFQYRGNGAASQLVSQIRERAFDPTITPIAVLPCHAHHQGFDLSYRTWSSGRAPATAIVFLSDQFAMPAQQCFTRHNRSLLFQPLPEGFCSDGQSSPLIIVESKAPFPQLLPQHPVLLAQIIDELVLAVIHPACQGDQHEMERIEDLLHVVPSLSPE